MNYVPRLACPLAQSVRLVGSLLNIKVRKVTSASVTKNDINRNLGNRFGKATKAPAYSGWRILSTWQFDHLASYPAGS